jgi:hypothetical protein
MSAPEIFAFARVVNANALIEITDAVTGVHYVAEAPPRTDPAAAAWKCSAVFPLAGGGRRIKHAIGVNAPGALGENLSALTYS